MLEFPVKPMLLQAAGVPFDSPDHLFEWKVDGIRCIMFYQNGAARLQSKTGKDCSRQFPELLAPSLNVNEAILDGEIAIINDKKPDFEGVMERYMAGPRKIISLSHTKPAVYIVWDILWLNGCSLMHLPLVERKAILEGVLHNNDYVKKIEFIESEGTLLWNAIKEHQLEGMVAKHKKARYHSGRRTSAFIKIKNYQFADVNVFGYKKRDGFILVGTGAVIQGHALGIGRQDKAALWELIKEYGESKGDSIMLPPGIRGRVKFTTWSSGGKMRDCSWQGFVV